ncbi:hypothetical protein KUCAC02_027893, partial [Chaenocephalus aceratus]
MKVSPAVILIGPSGSGKTTCRCALAEALNHLAALTEHDNRMEGDTPQISTWNSVDTVVLFPNAMSHKELFGSFCEKRGWQDGAVVKVLRDSEPKLCNKNQKSDQIRKWLVMDGNPVGWLDYLTTMCSPQDPFLCLSSGEILPSQPHLRLVMEVTDLRDASPSAVTRCSLVYFSGSDLWKAVWRSAMDALSSEHKLDQGTLNMWNPCREGRGQSWGNTTSGHKDAPLHRAGTDSKGLLNRNLFLLAYIWGFSGHLHPRHRPRFDSVAHQVLFTCRYRIVVPDGESVFEYFFNIDIKTCSKNTLLTKSIPPMYRKYASLLNIMLEANQPVLLSGETRLWKNDSTINCTKNCRDTQGPNAKQTGLLVFVDDLHEAASDVFGKMSTALDTLRQSISMGRILTFDGYNFKLLSAASLSYMATCCVSGSHSTVISSRLSRLFSSFVLPSLSMDVILSIHSPRLKMWLKETQLTQSAEDMACCIITATKNVYDAVCDQFKPTVQRPLFIFSHHDLQKVFKGLCLWQPDRGTMQQKEETILPESEPVLNISHLWMHECLRTFSDRLCSEDDSKTLASLIAMTATTHYGSRLTDATSPVSLEVTRLDIHTLPSDTEGQPIAKSLGNRNLPQETKPAGQSDLKKGQTLTEPSSLSGNISSVEESLKTHAMQPQILQHMEDKLANLVYGPDLSEAPMNQKHLFKCSFTYQDRDLEVLLQQLRVLISRNKEDKGQEADYNILNRCVVHRQRVGQLLHILRALLIPGGHGLLMASNKGTGRKTTVRLAALITGYLLMEVHPGNEDELHEILKEAVNKTRVDGVRVIILVHEGVSQPIRWELLAAMAHQTQAGLYTEDLRNVVSRATDVRKSRRYRMDYWMSEKYFSQLHRNVHVFLLLPFTMTDSSEAPANNGDTQLMKALSLSVCVDIYQPWSRLSLVEVAAQCLKTNPLKTERDTSEAGLSVVMAGIHQSACQYASVLLRDQTFNPQTFLEFIAHFHHLFKHLHAQLQSRANRLAAVLSRLDVMSGAAARYKQNLVKLQEEVSEAQQRELELLSALDHQRILLEEAQESCVVEENKLYDLEEQVSHTHKQLLSCLNPCDLEEVRHYRDPPEGVVRIMDAVCLLFKPSAGLGERQAAAGTRTNFFQELEFFERRSVSAERLQQLALMVHSPQFVPESVQGRTRRKRRQEEEKIQLEGVREKLKETEKRMQTAERSEREAAAAVEKMETLFTEWRAAKQEAESDHKSLSGDALLLAAIISYLSPFGPDTRSELLNKWRDLMSKRLPVWRVLGGLQESLPNERMLVKLLLSGNTKRDWVQRWNLLTDNQKHLDILSNSCIHTGEKASLEKETECATVLCADDPDLMHKLDRAAEEGLRVLVTHVERLTPTPRFLERLSRPAGCVLPGLEHLVQPPHPEFCLLLSTDLPAHLLHTEIHPSVLSLVAVLDLSLSAAEVQQLMLSQLLQNQRKKVLSRHSQLQSDKQLLEHTLISEQDPVRFEFLLDSILQSDSPLLEELQHHDVLLKAPRNLVKLASTFYQALQEVSRLSSDYCFPLQGFISALQEAFIVEGCEVELSNRLVEKLLHHYRPSLYSAHLPALELLFSLAVLQHHSLCSDAEKAVFLRGLQDVPLPVTKIKRILPFRGLISSLCSSPAQWDEYLHSSDHPPSVSGPVPCRSHSHLSLIQRGILLKTLLPHSLQGLNQDMAVYHRPLLGGRETPYIGNPKALYQFLRKHEGPVILTSPNQRGEERTSIHPLKLIHSLAHCGEDTQVQVRVVSFGADREVILSHLSTAATDGHWLVFINCQLPETWDTKVTAHIHQLISSLREERRLVHPSFRLWFITQENTSTSIPASVRVCALPLVVSSCLDLKEQLILSFQQLHSFSQRPSLSGVSSEDMELLMNTAVFHSVILQRHKHRGGRHS